VSKDACAGDVGRLHGIWVSFTIAAQKLNELVNKVRVGPAVTSALRKAEVFLTVVSTVDTTCGERSDFVR
jgi:type II secretory pathway component PulF